ncbi:HNH endonuclease signature motif containing protein [Streptomyces sp. NPDC048507]|uniref:HNH endonuclease signature motif containing protein n=1 Tax=Streptomyces sp. NPDC048507 TaxID=3365560 RepID=UPI0037212FB3
MNDIEERFWSKVDASGVCWEWTAAKSNGYGRFGFEGRNQYAHRVAYTLLAGGVPDGMTLDHLCRNRACVNPDHLEPVTHRENIRRGGTVQRNLSRTHCPQGHPYSGENLKTHGSKRQCRTCHRQAYIPIPPKTHCKNGHPFDAENTSDRMMRGRIIRRCKTCQREGTARYRAKKKKEGG